jgi:hypothetical protein
MLLSSKLYLTGLSDKKRLDFYRAIFSCASDSDLTNEMVPPASRVSKPSGVKSRAETIMEDVTLVGIDLGKHTFHLHGQDKNRKGLFRKKLNRKQTIELFATFPCLHRGDGGLRRRTSHGSEAGVVWTSG